MQSRDNVRCGGERERECVCMYLKHNFNVKLLKALVHHGRQGISTVLDSNLP